jgi:ankyrin repeat protein
VARDLTIIFLFPDFFANLSKHRICRNQARHEYSAYSPQTSGYNRRVRYRHIMLNDASDFSRSGLSDTHLHRTLSNGSLSAQEAISDSNSDGGEDSEEDEFVYPGVTSAAQAEAATPSHSTLLQRHPSPAQLESLYAAASSGDLSLLKKLFRNALQTGDVEAFALANDASSRTGLTALHAAANRGFLDVVKWCKPPNSIAVRYLLMDLWQWWRTAALFPTLRIKKARLIRQHHTDYTNTNSSSQTALHKSALQGHLSIVMYLLPDKADVHARDADGWTALHNACSKVRSVLLVVFLRDSHHLIHGRVISML